MSWELMSYGELMSGGTNVLDSMEHIDPIVSRAKALKLELGCKSPFAREETIMRMHKGLPSA